MSRVLTGDKLVESIRNRAMIPNDTSVYTDENLLDIANEEIDVQLLDKLLSLHEEHLTVPVEIARNQDGVYEIPYRAVGNKIRDIALISGSTIYEMTQVSIGELSDFTLDSEAYTNGFDKFYIEHNKIKLINPTRSYEKVRIYFHIRPNYLTKLEKAATISSIVVDDLNDEVTYNFTSTPTAFNASILYDFVGAKTPNKIKAYDIAPKEVNTGLNFVKFNKSDVESVIDEVIVGDYICVAEESPVPNIPTEMHPVLAQLVAVHVLEAMGDTEGLANAEKRLNKMITSVMQLVDDRVELAPRKIRPRNGTLAEGRYGSYRRRGR
jgi:hypothetical protein